MKLLKTILVKTIKYSLILSFTFLFFLVGFLLYLGSDFNKAISKEQLKSVYDDVKKTKPVTDAFYEASNYINQQRDVIPHFVYGLYTVNNSYAGKGECSSYWLSRLITSRELGKTRGELREYKSIFGLTFKLERRFSQKQCFSALLKRFYFGYGVQGVRNASQKYFQKELEELTQIENRILALMVTNPTLYNPIRSPEKIEEKLKQLEMSKKN